jgi:RND family efflux transporter MFP subunit
MRFIPLTVLSLALIAGGCVDRQKQDQAKETAKVINDPTVEVVAQAPVTKTLQQTAVVTGNVTTSADSEVGPKFSGRVVRVFVNDGDSVSAGQPLAQLDTSILSSQLSQAMGQESSARATLNQAQSAVSQALRNQAVNPSKSAAAIRSAQARLRSAQANLAKLRTGARPQERIQAQAQVASAKANLDTQTKQLERIRNLVQQGALAGSQLDTQQAAYEAARTTYENAVQSLALIREGNRTEDITAAQEEVRSAQEDVNTARANRELDASYADQVANAQAQVQAARAQIQSAQAAVAQARQNLADATVTAPFAGKVSGRPVQPGTVVGAGTSIVRLVGTQGVYFEGDIPGELVNNIQSGQSVAISIDAVPGRTFPGTVRTVGALGSSVGRLFSARIAFLGAPAEVKPGMFARGSIILKTVPGATVLPSTAVLKDDTGSYVMVAEGNKAHKLRVTTGLVQGDETQVHGLPSSERVIVQGQNNLLEGAQIRVVPAGAKA